MIFKKYKNRKVESFQFRIVNWNQVTGKEKWTAIIIQFPKYTFWVFRNSEIRNHWPNANN